MLLAGRYFTGKAARDSALRQFDLEPASCECR